MLNLEDGKCARHVFNTWAARELRASNEKAKHVDWLINVAARLEESE